MDNLREHWIKKFGKDRGFTTGRRTANDKDIEWLARATEGIVQCTDPQDLIAYEQGLAEGADLADEVEHDMGAGYLPGKGS